MQYVNLDQNKDKWRTFVNKVINTRFPKNAKNILTS